MELLDAHCHLQSDRLAAALDAVLARAGAAGVTRMACCGTSERDWPGVARVAATCGAVMPSFGIHPWYSRDRSPQWREALRAILAEHPGAGVGEIGLDHAIEPLSREDQTALFLDQAKLAAELNRPASVHCRRAWHTLFESLKQLPKLSRGFVIHSYSGEADMIPTLAKLGAYFSFSGSATLPGNRKARANVPAVPQDRLLIETDSPDLMPVIDGKRADDVPNEPANLVHVLDKVAELRNMSREDLAQLTMHNGLTLFGRI